MVTIVPDESRYWSKWFAWYPVKIPGIIGNYWVWLRYIHRKLYRNHNNEFYHWEYER